MDNPRVICWPDRRAMDLYRHQPLGKLAQEYVYIVRLKCSYPQGKTLGLGRLCLYVSCVLESADTRSGRADVALDEILTFLIRTEGRSGGHTDSLALQRRCADQTFASIPMSACCKNLKNLIEGNVFPLLYGLHLRTSWNAPRKDPSTSCGISYSCARPYVESSRTSLARFATLLICWHLEDHLFHLRAAFCRPSALCPGIRLSLLP